MEQRLKVGVIASPHGLKGEVKVFPTTDDAKRFKKLKEVMMEAGTEYKTLTINGLKFSGKFVIIKFAGFDRIEDVQPYKGMGLWVDRKDAVRLKKDEYFVADLLELKVVDEDFRELGTVKEVIHTGANDVYVIKTAGKDLLIPAIKECILEIDVESRMMRVHLLEGLLDL